MKTFNHTPGPWEAIRLDPQDGDSFFIEEPGERGIVAEVLHICTEEWTEANARLIAVAPEMLAYVVKKAKEGDKEAKEIIKHLT